MNAGTAGQALVIVITLAAVCIVAVKAIARRYARNEAEFLSEWNETHRSRLSIVPASTDYVDDEPQAFALDDLPLSISQYIAKTEAAERNRVAR